MLNTLMDISEAESGAVQLQLEPVHLADVIARAVDLYRDVAEAKGVALVVGADSSVGAVAPDVTVRGDRTRLEQVAANLIDNALKYTPAGGHVDVDVIAAGPDALLRVRSPRAPVPADH